MLTAIARNRVSNAAAILRTARMGRSYSERTGTAGATATSSGFSKKEQAQENQYAKKTEQLQLEKLRQQLNAHKEELAKLEKQVDEQSKAAKK
ncbi:hypothetical protein FRB96_004785 [Tulasnella sp. 330]|nr:hypothetical protein FRB96_004785 [Tulasnella sp. 330]KAG8870808.1 hypothetical protein FRB97_009339 [Tulasnella sp. 331]KAG8873059.1 hypothetical protein FRB98_009214 [Tulasnella sp. 332]